MFGFPVPLTNPRKKDAASELPASGKAGTQLD